MQHFSQMEEVWDTSEKGEGCSGQSKESGYAGLPRGWVGGWVGSCKQGWLHKVEEYQKVEAAHAGRRPTRPSAVMKEIGSLTQVHKEVRVR